MIYIKLMEMEVWKYNLSLSPEDKRSVDYNVNLNSVLHVLMLKLSNIMLSAFIDKNTGKLTCT